jgi:tRNA threonylcarbamoyl adenosine modification protein (Sua5/YciO/YrdC/YwlC family)
MAGVTTLTKTEILLHKRKYSREIMHGAVFVYPTDTIYGIGCSAVDSTAVLKVREIKQRPNDPFSVLVPSKDWILENCEVSEEGRKWIEKLPGPYTLIFRLKNKRAIMPEVNVNMDTLGVRIPDHWMSKFVKELGVPIISTSANVSGENYMTSIDDLDERVSSRMNFIIYVGPKKGKPSTLVNLSTGKAEMKERK